jgi:hypothetical protein
MMDRIESIVLKDLQPVTPLPSSLTLRGTLSLLFLAVLGARALLVRIRGWQAIALQMKVSIFAPLLLGPNCWGWPWSGEMVPGQSSPTRPVAWSVVAATLAVSRREEPCFLEDGLSCFSAGMMYALPAALMVWLVIRRGSMLSVPLVCAMAGGLAGSIALA